MSISWLVVDSISQTIDQLLGGSWQTVWERDVGHAGEGLSHWPQPIDSIKTLTNASCRSPNMDRSLSGASI